MIRKSALASTLAAATFVCALPAQAADLGTLRVLSPSGEALHAEIAIDAIGSDHEAGTLKAALAPREVYDQTHLEYKESLADLKVEIQDRPGGRKVVSITSSKPVEAGVLDLLVELTWNMGRFIRQYTFILDAPAPLAAAPEQTLPSTVPVAPGDTLSGIAGGLQPGGATLDQTMAALLHANPKAFVGGDMNRLRAGARLNVPAPAAIEAEDAAQAQALVRQQTAAFESYRQRLAGKAAQVLPPETEAGQTASGRIEPMPQEEGPEPGGDALKLSSDGSAQDARRDQAAEARDATGKAVDEAASRLKELQGNVDAMRGLLEAQNDTGAQAQQQAEAALAQDDKADGAQAAGAQAAGAQAAGAQAADAKAAAGQAADRKAVLGAILAVLAAIVGALILRRRNERKDGLGADGAAALDEDAPGAAAVGAAAGAAAAYAAQSGDEPAAEPVNYLKDWDDIPPFPIPETLPPAEEAAALADDPYEEDFDEVPPLPGHEPLPMAAQAPAAFDLDLNLDQPVAEAEAPAAAGAKLDLAKAYVELGDRKGARELLEEILQAGSPDQQARARTLLASL